MSTSNYPPDIWSLPSTDGYRGLKQARNTNSVYGDRVTVARIQQIESDAVREYSKNLSGYFAGQPERTPIHE